MSRSRVSARRFSSLSSYVKVDPFGSPHIQNRQQAFWGSSVTLQVTQPGFPEGRASTSVSTDDGRLTGLAQLYPRLVNGDAVRKRMRKPIYGALGAQTLLTPQGDPLPLFRMSAVSRSGATSIARVRDQARAFAAFIAANQAAGKVPAGQRVELRVIAGPTHAYVVSPPSKTVPVLVFLSMLTATFALVVVLENRRKSRASETHEHVDDHADRDVGRSVVAFEKPSAVLGGAKPSVESAEALNGAGARSTDSAVVALEKASVTEKSPTAIDHSNERPSATSGVPGPTPGPPGDQINGTPCLALPPLGRRPSDVESKRSAGARLASARRFDDLPTRRDLRLLLPNPALHLRGPVSVARRAARRPVRSCGRLLQEAARLAVVGVRAHPRDPVHPDSPLHNCAQSSFSASSRTGSTSCCCSLRGSLRFSSTTTYASAPPASKRRYSGLGPFSSRPW